MHKSRNAKVTNRRVFLGDCRYQRVRFKASLKTCSRDLILCIHNNKSLTGFTGISQRLNMSQKGGIHFLVCLIHTLSFGHYNVWYECFC